MKASIYKEFGGPIEIQEVADPNPTEDGVVIKVEATGICRSDWHGWLGHDPDITLPHVPGHELAGVIQEVGSGVKSFQEGDRVTLPFVCGCGHCIQCVSGNHQVCDNQFQPGFTHWGSFAEYVSIHYAEENLVRLPEDMSFTTAASLGCRFATSFRGVKYQGEVKEGDWVAVHGCGGVGLSAIMIAKSLGAKVIGVDNADPAIMMARKAGADATITAMGSADVVEDIRTATDGGADVSIEALGSKETTENSIRCLRKRGRHVQIGLMAGNDQNPPVPMHEVIANELELVGSHGLQAHVYPEMLAMISSGLLKPQLLLREEVSLDVGIELLQQMDQEQGGGIAVITDF